MPHSLAERGDEARLYDAGHTESGEPGDLVRADDRAVLYPVRDRTGAVAGDPFFDHVEGEVEGGVSDRVSEALLVGFLISLFQAATQIQEPTLSFVPKMIAVSIALLLTGNWVLAGLANWLVIHAE